MLKMKPNNQHSGIYRTRDSIENFKMRITLRKLYSTIKIPKFEAFQSIVSSDQQATTDFEETVTISWQEKVFSKTERSYYTQKENCKSELEKRYHQMLREDTETESGLIFTYIHDDNYSTPDNFGPRDVTVTQLRQKVEENLSRNEEKKNSSDIFADPKSSDVSARYDLGENFIKLSVLADLDPTTLLVTIKYRPSDGLFIVYPDFNDTANEYQLEIDQNSKQIYVYVVENLSLTVNDDTNRQLQKEKLDKIQEETCALMQKLNVTVDHDFVYPKFCRIVLMMEILDARNFEFDNIHVQFKIKLPKFVKLVDGILEGSTHSSFRNIDTFNFGYCHALVVDIDDEFLISNSQLDKIELNFEVISIDSLWERERREGLAHLKIPLEVSGGSNKSYELHCFRDLQGNSGLRDFFERFFLGGIHKMETVESNNENVMNFYGNQTVSTGTLKVKIQKIQQMKPSMRNNLKLKSVDEIISSYQKAKSKLEGILGDV